MMSPNHIFAAEYGHAFGSQQPSSSSLAAGFGSQAGGLSASLQSMVHPAVVAGSNTEGSFGGGTGLTDSSFSKGGSYTIAESSYSPKHCRPGGDPVTIWQRYGHQQELLPDSSASQQQQQQQVLPARLSGLCGEPSLRAPQGWCSAAGAAPVADAAAPAAPATVDVSDITLQQQPAPAGLQPQGSDFSLQPLQPARRQQQQAPQAQGGQGTQPGAGQEVVPAGSGDGLQLRQGSAESAGTPHPKPSPAALQAKQLVFAMAASGSPTYTADEYRDLMVRARASPTKPMSVMVAAAAAQPGPADAAALRQGPAVLQPASLPRPSQQQDEQQHANAQVPASPQWQVLGAGQQQQQQQHPPRPSPLGPSKAPAQLAGWTERQAGSGNGSVYVSGPGAAASGPQGNLAAEQQVLSGGSGWVSAVTSVAAEARRVLDVLAGAVDAERPQQSTSPRGVGPRSALLQAAAAAAAAAASPQQQQQQQGGPANRTAALAPLAAADAGPGSSTCSSSNNSPRFASAPSGAQRVSSNAMSLHSCIGTSGQGSPRGSLPTTPRSMQRASLAAGSFVSAAGSAAPGSPSGRAGSSGSMGTLGAQQAWAGAGVGCQAAGEAADSDDFDEDAMFCGPGVSSGCRARTPSGLLLAPKEALGAIPELPAAFESRTSDPSNPTSTDRP